MIGMLSDPVPGSGLRRIVPHISLKRVRIRTPMLAIPTFRSRVAPVLNWCSRMLIIPENETDEAADRELVLNDMSGFDRLRALREKGVDTLICGAVSPELLNYGEDLGLRIIHGVAGEIDEVLQAYYEGQLDQPRFRLPGYR